MGSQTLEILRQGVWASLTGGWFYDPHQTVFCNSVHLYLWLFLLCSPFTAYLYFPRTLPTWIIYCLMTGCMVAAIKLINSLLHIVYDREQIISEENIKKSTKNLPDALSEEDGGIEMQELPKVTDHRLPAAGLIEPGELSHANSTISLDYLEQAASTIDLKVDVHRKNSSESSDGNTYPVATSTAIKPYQSESTTEQTVINQRYRRSLKTKSKSDDGPNVIKEEGGGDHGGPTDEMFVDNINRFIVQAERVKEDQRRRLRNRKQRTGRQVSLDEADPTVVEFGGYGAQGTAESMPAIKIRFADPNPKGFRRYNTEYLEPNFTTKSELSIDANLPIDRTGQIFCLPRTGPMRKDSDSTMSATQLFSTGGIQPTEPVNGPVRMANHLRRHSNSTGNRQQPVATVRRIKSAALEICCPQPSVSNLSPHPNSVETIGGHSLRNPAYAVLPPPSQSLVRNARRNLYPKGTAGVSVGQESNQMITEPVYPIAESDGERMLTDTFIMDSDSNDEDRTEHNGDEEPDDEDTIAEVERIDEQPVVTEKSTTTSESDFERPQTQSTDSDTENNGSQSPLLDAKTRFYCLSGCGSKEQRNKSIGIGDPPGLLSDSERASATSKDMLLNDRPVGKGKQPVGEKKWFDFSMDSNSITVDVIDPGEGSSKMLSDKPPLTDQTGGKSLGAIPKQLRTKQRSFENPDDPDGIYSPLEPPKSKLDLPKSNSTSRTSSSASLRYDYDRPPVLHQTKDGGWVLQSASATNPVTAMARGEPPPLMPLYSRNEQNLYAPDIVYRPPMYMYRPYNKGGRRSFTTRLHGHSFDSGDHPSGDLQSTESTAPTTHDTSEISESINASLLMRELMMEERFSIQRPLPNDRTVGTSTMPHMSYDSVFNDWKAWKDYNMLSGKQTGPPKRMYKIPIRFLGIGKDIRIAMDRLQLLALFDRDLNWFQTVLAILLAALISILGSIILQMNIYKDLFAFLFCFVMAGSQYSLLKSVQPDAASPVHGFNKTVAYSRPIYFCLCSGLLIFAHHLRMGETIGGGDKLLIFGVPIESRDLFQSIEYLMEVMLLFLPILFSLGLFPQINTFLMYILEQVDMHLFGGSAVCGLLAAFLGLIRSILACCLLYGPAFGGLSERKGTQHVLFSCFTALLIVVSYHLSRTASDFTYVWALIKSSLAIHTDEDEEDPVGNSPVEKSTISVDGGPMVPDKQNQPEQPISDTDSMETEPKEPELEDPLPKKLQSTVNARLKNDCLVCLVAGVIILSLHCSTVFTVLQPELNTVLHSVAVILGFILHYIVPQMRKHLPWLCVARPILQQREFGQIEVKDAAKIMWFEQTYVLVAFFERNILYPLIFMSALTADSVRIAEKFGLAMGAVIVCVCGLKGVRSSYSEPSSQYLILLFSVLFFRMDYSAASETFLIDFFVMAIVYRKLCEFMLKLQFIVTYIAPWQITWGSAFHAFAQPFSVPHSAMLFLQAAISATLSTPLNPFLGSAIFLTSYVRPIKFWERDYNTRRIDHSNTRLSSQLERDLGADDNNLNSIFYEHLTRSLQHSLCGDLLLGRWGNVSQGDCFVLASDYLNCLVHIIELGNGLCTFQMRGLEFRGTYCQQREVEAISEGLDQNEGCCCCTPGHLPHMLSVNAMFTTRWLAWQVVQSQYVLEGYSISDNLAQATLQVFEFRKVLITYYVKSIIYYTVRSPKLTEWLTSPAIRDALQSTQERQFVDLDPIFNHNLDEDFDFRASGITRSSFYTYYQAWIQFCCTQRNSEKQRAAGTKSTAGDSDGTSPRSSSNPTPSPRVDVSKIDKSKTVESKVITDPINTARDSPLISLVLALGLLARRTLATASHSSLQGVEYFLHGLHALFKGDFRITSSRDEWVFADMDLLHSVIAPAVKMSLKLHQDHFLSPDEYDDPTFLYEAIETHSKELVISHEADPLWRNAVLRGAPNLLALRHVMEDGCDEYRLIRLTKRFLTFRVIKLNRECVRGLWAGQQQELIYLRNRNPERGSIQNAKQALRNIINSSCDQPIGYPIYVSPLTTSYAETNEQLCRIVGGAITLEKIHQKILKFCRRVRERCREGCSSGSVGLDAEIGDVQGIYCTAQTPNNTLSGTTGTLSYGSQSLSGAGNRGSLASMGKPTSSTLLAGLLNRDREVGGTSETVRSKRIPKSDRERRATLPVASGSVTTGIKQFNDLPASGLKPVVPLSASTRDVDSSSSCGPVSGSKPNQTLSSSTKDVTGGKNPTDIGTKTNNSLSAGDICTGDDGPMKLHRSGPIKYKKHYPGRMAGPSSSRTLKIEKKSKSEERDDRITESQPPPPDIRVGKKVIIVDSGEIYDCLNLGRRIDVSWPSEAMQSAGGRSSWRDWTPQDGMVGFIVHYWQPNHPDIHFRSTLNRTLYLIQIGDRYVPIAENGVREYNTVGPDERIKIVHIPKDELRLSDDARSSNDVELVDEDENNGGQGKDGVVLSVDEDGGGSDDRSDKEYDDCQNGGDDPEHIKVEADI